MAKEGGSFSLPLLPRTQLLLAGYWPQSSCTNAGPDFSWTASAADSPVYRHSLAPRYLLAAEMCSAASWSALTGSLAAFVTYEGLL